MFNTIPSVKNSQPMKIYADRITAETNSWWNIPSSSFQETILFRDIIKIKGRKDRVRLPPISDMLEITLSNDKKYFIRHYFLENINFGDIINIIAEYRKKHSLSSLKLVGKIPHEELDKEDKRVLLEEWQSDEKCPSCSYEFTNYATIEPKQKTLEVICPRCHHIFKKRITKKMLKEAERL